MRRKLMFLASASLALSLGLGVAAAKAAVYNFDVTYLGGGNAVLAAGSDDMLSVTPGLGDTINYSISTTGGAHWNTIQDGSGLFLFGAIGDLLGDFGQVQFDYSASFNFLGVTQYSESGSGAQGNADLGPRKLLFPTGIHFDNFSETLTIDAVDQPFNFDSLLPSWGGQAPEAGAPKFFTYSSGAVPEPATWAMMLLGFGLVGAGVRQTARRRFA